MATNRSIIILIAFVGIPGGALAQADRYEVGRRLRALEVAFDEQTDPEARKRVTSHLTKGTFAFLANRYPEASRSIDKARFALQSAKDPEPAVVWASSLWLNLDSRFLELPAAFPLRMATLYKVDIKRPEQASMRYGWRRCGDEEWTPADQKPLKLDDSPGQVTPLFDSTPAKEGDYQLRMEILVDGRVVATSVQSFSLADKLHERMQRIKKTIASWPVEPGDTDKETVRALMALLHSMAYERKTLETDYPATRLLAEVETAVKAVEEKKSYYGNGKTGQFWLTLATAKGLAPIRLLAPKEAGAGKPLPLVFALHGAGGSENMFFDAYGNGALVRECEKRGWLLVATRSSLGFGRGPPLTELLDEVNRLYPVDKKRVYLVGHSMGAAQSVAAACQMPERIAGVAALGGGGTVKASAALKDVPFFVGVGSEDFALGSARALRDSLQKAGVQKLTFREYENVEHLLVVQVGLKDVFGFFEAK